MHSARQSLHHPRCIPARSVVVAAMLPLVLLTAAQADPPQSVVMVQPNHPVSIASQHAGTDSNAVTAWMRQNAGDEPSVHSDVSGGAAADNDNAAGGKLVRRRGTRESSAAQARSVDAGFGTGGYAQMLWPLMAVLGTIGLLAMLFRRWNAGGPRSTGEAVIRVLARHYLSNKQSLCLVRVGQRVVLLGVTPESISACASIEDPEEVSNLITTSQRSTPGSFTSALTAFTHREVAAEAISPKLSARADETILPGRAAATADNLRDVLDRLQQLSAGTSRSTPA